MNREGCENVLRDNRGKMKAIIDKRKSIRDKITPELDEIDKLSREYYRLRGINNAIIGALELEKKQCRATLTKQ